MNTDFKTLEKRYGTLVASTIFAEIMRADQRKFSFYRIPEAIAARIDLEENDFEGTDQLTENSKAA